MESLRVNEDALHVTAARWHRLGDQLAASAPNAPAPSFQASAAAVDAIHAGAAAAGAVFTSRVQITAVKTVTAALAYNSNEAHATTQLGAIAKSL
jgi:hypothetical protein